MVKIGGLILAAGQSQRFGRKNKLLSKYLNKPLIDYPLACLSALPLNEKIIVSGYDRENLEKRARLYKIQPVYNPKFENGIGHSIATGVRALPETLDAYFILLGDLPRVKTKLCIDILTAFKRSDGNAIIRPVYEGQAGHPVLIPAKYRDTLTQLTNDMGLRGMIKSLNIPVIHVNCTDGTCLADIDTENDLPSNL